MVDRILIGIAVKDRPTEVFGLLTSLMNQTYDKWDALLLDDGSGTPLHNYYFINYLITRLKYQGHDIKIIRNEFPSGVSKARQQLATTSLKFPHKYFARIDDDCICLPDYLEKLMKVIDAGYDIASGLTIPIHAPDMVRDIKFVSPVIGYCELDKEGNLIANYDDCGNRYSEEVILPSPHFRSCAVYKREVHEAGVDYESRLSKNGFREEQIISFKAILKGFKIGVHTGAINLHLMTPSGGERDTMNMTQFNQQVFEETVKRMFEDNGDFLSAYYKKCGVTPRKLSSGELLKSTNLVSKKEDINLLNES